MDSDNGFQQEKRLMSDGFGSDAIAEMEQDTSPCTEHNINVHIPPIRCLNVDKNGDVFEAYPNN